MPEMRVRNVGAQSGTTRMGDAKSSKQLWIAKDKNGDYYFDSNKVFVKNRGADYAKIFDAVFSLIPNGGKVSYQKVIEACKTRGLETSQKAIQRALTGKEANFFRYVTTIRQQPAYGTPLFVPATDGTEIEFNNKR